MKSILSVWLVCQFLFPLSLFAADRNALHRQHSQKLRQKEVGLAQTLDEATQQADNVPGNRRVKFDPTYEAKRIISLARRRPVAHNGLMINNVVNLSRYPSLEDVEQPGNFLASSRARYINNVTTGRGLRIRTPGSSVKIGSIEHYGDAKELINIVDIRGHITAQHIDIGSVMNAGDIRSIYSSVTLGGSTSSR